MISTASRTLKFSNDPQTVHAHVKEALQDLFGREAKLTPDGSIQLTTGLTLKSWGEVIHATIAPADPGTVVTIRSTSRLSSTRFDWGKNTENLKNIADELRQRLTYVP